MPTGCCCPTQATPSLGEGTGYSLCTTSEGTTHEDNVVVLHSDFLWVRKLGGQGRRVRNSGTDRSSLSGPAPGPYPPKVHLLRGFYEIGQTRNNGRELAIPLPSSPDRLRPSGFSVLSEAKETNGPYPRRQRAGFRSWVCKGEHVYFLHKANLSSHILPVHITALCPEFNSNYEAGRR